MIKKSILKIQNLNKFLDKKQVLFDVNLEIFENEVFWFLWPNWAGKTTTMKCILNLIKADSWEILILWSNSLNNDTKKKIGFMPENAYLYKHLNWKEFLRFNWNFFYNDKNKLEKKIDSVLKKVWLDWDWEKLLAKYSKWMLQRIGLAQAIINEPKIVFLDEPMSGLDPIWRKMAKDLILNLKKNWTTVFFNTHILSDVENICDRFAIINKGKIIVEEKVKNIKWSLEDYFIKKVSK